MLALLLLLLPGVLAGLLENERSSLRLRSRDSLRSMREARGQRRRRAAGGPSSVPVAPLPGEIVTSRYLLCPQLSGTTVYNAVLFGAGRSTYLFCQYDNNDLCNFASDGSLAIGQSNAAACTGTSATSEPSSASDSVQYTACPATDLSSPPSSLQTFNSQLAYQSYDGSYRLYCAYNSGVCTYSPVSGSPPPDAGNAAVCPPSSLQASSQDGYINMLGA